MSLSTSDCETLHNKLSVLLAHQQRIACSSLLPSLKRKRSRNNNGASSPPPRTEEEIEREEQEIFNPEPTLLGFGAKIPNDVDVTTRAELSSNDKLREQLLGKDYAKRIKKQKRSKLGEDSVGVTSIPMTNGSKPHPAVQKRAADSDSDSEDEAGRSSLGKPRRSGRKPDFVRPDEERKEEEEDIKGDRDAVKITESADIAVNGSKPQKKASNYLDEVLAQRSIQKQKKSKKRRKKREALAT